MSTLNSKIFIKDIANSCNCTKKQVRELNIIFAEVLFYFLKSYTSVTLEGFADFKSEKKLLIKENIKVEDFIKKISNLSGLSENYTSSYLMALISYLSENLGKNYSYSIEIDRVGIFSNKSMEGFGGVNFATGEAVAKRMLYEVRDVCFRSSPELVQNEIKFMHQIQLLVMDTPKNKKLILKE